MKTSLQALITQFQLLPSVISVNSRPMKIPSLTKSSQLMKNLNQLTDHELLFANFRETLKLSPQCLSEWFNSWLFKFKLVNNLQLVLKTAEFRFFFLVLVFFIPPPYKRDVNFASLIFLLPKCLNTIFMLLKNKRRVVLY